VTIISARREQIFLQDWEKRADVRVK